MARIKVDPKREEPPWAFTVEVVEQGGSSLHDVTLNERTYKRLTDGTVPPERFVAGCFTFLLERESKESILASFDVEDIGTYFDEFEAEIGGYL